MSIIQLSFDRHNPQVFKKMSRKRQQFMHNQPDLLRTFSRIIRVNNASLTDKPFVMDFHFRKTDFIEQTLQVLCLKPSGIMFQNGLMVN